MPILSVSKAARVLGVHPNTVRNWSDAGQLRYYRINARGDRRYQPDDLERFLAERADEPDVLPEPACPLVDGAMDVVLLYREAVALAREEAFRDLRELGLTLRVIDDVLGRQGAAHRP
jgi:excisionase family DNA binding protein